MNVKDFIESKGREYFENTTHSDAFTEYMNHPDRTADSSSIFFKIKYNAYCRELGIQPIQTSEIADLAMKPEEKKTVTTIVAGEEVPADDAPVLPKRVIVNYKEPTTETIVPKTIPTGTIFDRIISKRFTTNADKEAYKETYGTEMPENMYELGGFTRQCVDITAGKAGSGKTYSRAILAAKAKIFARAELGIDIRVGFISAEMRKSEWDSEVEDCELLKELEVDYMLNYVGYANYEEIFWEAVADYDIVIVDSFPAVLSHFRMMPGEKRTEKAMTFDFIRQILQSVEENNNNVQLINQAVKDGNYKGGTELPHMMSSMSFVHIDGQQRYMSFDKNRNNGTTCKRKLYFTKTDSGDLKFNEEVYMASYEQVEDKKATVEELINTLNDSEGALDKLDGTNGDGTELTAAEMEENDQREFEASDAIETTDEENTIPDDSDVGAYHLVNDEITDHGRPLTDLPPESNPDNLDENGYPLLVENETEETNEEHDIPQEVINAPFRNRRQLIAEGADNTPAIEREPGHQIDLEEMIEEVEQEKEEQKEAA